MKVFKWVLYITTVIIVSLIALFVSYKLVPVLVTTPPYSYLGEAIGSLILHTVVWFSAIISLLYGLPNNKDN